MLMPLPDLSDPRVQEAKRSFERRRSRCRLGFEELLGRFAAGETFERIGASAGLTKDAMWRIFHKDFRELFPERPRERIRRSLHQRKRSVARRIAFSDHPCEFVREVAKRARLHGCMVEAVPIQPARGIAWRGPYKHLLFVNGRLARVYDVRNVRAASSSGTKEYAKVRIIRGVAEEAEFAIFNVAAPGYPRRIFVVPTAALLAAYFADSAETTSKHIYIPLERWSVYHRPPRIDLWLFREAWHLVTRPDAN